jgi:O-antigen/teichoic acid export membrane protein
MLQKIYSLFSKKDDDETFFMQKSALALLLRAGGMFTQYLFVFITARLLGSKALGTYTLAYTVFQLVSIFALMGLDSLIVKTISKHRANSDQNGIKSDYLNSIQATTISSVCWGLALYIAAPWLAVTVFSKPALAANLQIVSAALLPSVFITINSAAFRGFKNMTGFLAFKALIPLSGSLLIGVSVYSHHALTPIVVFTISNFILAVSSYILWKKYSRLAEVPMLKRAPVRALVNDALPMMFTGSIFYILGWTDNLILGIFRSEAEVGIYDTAFKIAAASSIILISINAIQAPSFAELFHRNEIKKLQQSIFTSTRLLFWLTTPITLVILIFPQLILSVFGHEFIYASTALRILAFGSFVSCITGSVGMLLQMTGHQRPYNRIITVTAVTGVLLNFILIPRIGLLGAAISSCIAKVIQNIASAIYVKRKMGITCLYLPGMKPDFINSSTPK